MGKQTLLTALLLLSMVEVVGGNLTATGGAPPDVERMEVGNSAEAVGSQATSDSKFDETEWAGLYVLYTELSQKFGWTPHWDFTQGSKVVDTFEGLKIEDGHVVGIDFSGKKLTGLFPTGVFAFKKLSSLNLSSNNLSGDLPTAMAAALMKNPTATASISSLDISGNRFSGNVGILARCFPALTTLDVSDNAFEDVFPMISPNITHLDLSRQKMARVIKVNMTTLSVADMATLMPTILLYDHVNQTFKTSVNLLCTAAAPATFDKETSEDWAMQLSVQNGQIGIPYVSKQNAYHGKSGDSLNVLSMNNDGTIEGSSFKIAMAFEKGDANFVKGVDASDLQATILYAFGGYRSFPFNFTAADTFTDDNINVQDVVCTVNILLSGTVSANNAVRRRVPADTKTSDASVYVRNGEIVLDTKVAVAAICVKMTGDVNWNIGRYGMTQTVKAGALVGYSLAGSTLPIGETVLGSCSPDAKIVDVSMADRDANALNGIVGEGQLSSILSTDRSSLDGQKIYDLTGRQQTEWKTGVKIVTKDGRTIKVVKVPNR